MPGAAAGGEEAEEPGTEEAAGADIGIVYVCVCVQRERTRESKQQRTKNNVMMMRLLCMKCDHMCHVPAFVRSIVPRFVFVLFLTFS